MCESIVEIQKSPVKNKKYRAVIQNKTKVRTIDFGDNRYEQYYDSTPLKLYSHLNHMDELRRAKYYKRFSNVYDKDTAIDIEMRKSGKFTAKILSHMFLW